MIDRTHIVQVHDYQQPDIRQPEYLAGTPAFPTPSLVDKYGNVLRNPSMGLSRLEIYMLHCIDAAALEGRNGEPFNAEAIADRAWHLAKTLLEKGAQL